MNTKHHRERILSVLREAGRKGVSNVTLNSICFRYGARIFELRKLGYEIELEKNFDGTISYTLISEPNQLPLFRKAVNS